MPGVMVVLHTYTNELSPLAQVHPRGYRQTFKDLPHSKSMPRNVLLTLCVQSPQIHSQIHPRVPKLFGRQQLDTWDYYASPVPLPKQFKVPRCH